MKSKIYSLILVCFIVLNACKSTKQHEQSASNKKTNAVSKDAKEKTKSTTPIQTAKPISKDTSAKNRTLMRTYENR